jgi:hypothetical protein
MARISFAPLNAVGNTLRSWLSSLTLNCSSLEGTCSTPLREASCPAHTSRVASSGPRSHASVARANSLALGLIDSLSLPAIRTRPTSVDTSPYPCKGATIPFARAITDPDIDYMSSHARKQEQVWMRSWLTEQTEGSGVWMEEEGMRKMSGLKMSSRVCHADDRAATLRLARLSGTSKSISRFMPPGNARRPSRGTTRSRHQGRSRNMHRTSRHAHCAEKYICYL